ncbi:hypothetical protein P3T76_005885 [Phytophthora citrophthora]|uniref:Uncharacterized protein n=1 Tax=Phytophthora citrophthora TaxID=4793 RepID=A0AAD9GQ25_9STRA|nr:hypothetical protein P3T76_005885 [Phytophthora citrophthora]
MEVPQGDCILVCGWMSHPSNLRKECTERKFRLGTKFEHIQQLKAYGEAQRAVQSTVDEEFLSEPRLRKTKHCVIWLLNILRSDEFVQRLVSSGDSATRDLIDAGEVNQWAALWTDVGVQYRTNATDFNNLFSAAANDLCFADIDPSIIVQHESTKLYDM